MTARVHVYKPTPQVGVAFAILILLGIALPGLFIDPRGYIANGGIGGIATCGLFVFGLVLLARIHTRCTLDVASGVLTLERVAWPRATITRAIERDAIESIEVQRRGASGRVVIVLRGGEIVPLAMGRSSGGQHERSARALREMLGLPSSGMT